MEALSGTLMTAKKRGVVSYDGTLLLQRIHDEVRITLLLSSIPASPAGRPLEAPGSKNSCSRQWIPDGTNEHSGAMRRLQ